MRRLCFVSAVVVLSAGVCLAQESGQETNRRGLITTAPCPYSCREAGIPQDVCRESKDGNVCQVEDLSQPPGHRSLFRVKAAEYAAPIEKAAQPSQPTADRHGLITSSACPYDCKIAGVPADLCREWSDAEKCYVEDLSQPPGHRSRVSY